MFASAVMGLVKLLITRYRKIHKNLHVVYVKARGKIVDSDVTRVRREFKDYTPTTDENRDDRFIHMYRLVKGDSSWAISRILHMNDVIPMLLSRIDELEKK